MKVKENVYTCKTCRWFGNEDCLCTDEWCHCDGWTDPDEVEPTDDEKREIIGDLEYHRKVVED